jgi:hypothetical protein
LTLESESPSDPVHSLPFVSARIYYLNHPCVKHYTFGDPGGSLSQYLTLFQQIESNRPRNNWHSSCFVEDSTINLQGCGT